VIKLDTLRVGRPWFGLGAASAEGVTDRARAVSTPHFTIPKSSRVIRRALQVSEEYYWKLRMAQWRIRKASSTVIRHRHRYWQVFARLRRFPAAADLLLNDFREKDFNPTVESYEKLFSYFVHGWHTFRTDEGGGAFYPGRPSWSGPHTDALEGFSRIMPLFGAWVRSGRQPFITLVDGTKIDVAEEFRRGLVAGTEP